MQLSELGYKPYFTATELILSDKYIYMNKCFCFNKCIFFSNFITRLVYYAFMKTIYKFTKLNLILIKHNFSRLYYMYFQYCLYVFQSKNFRMLLIGKISNCTRRLYSIDLYKITF
jgi:hypothetical protein